MSSSGLFSNIADLFYLETCDIFITSLIRLISVSIFIY